MDLAAQTVHSYFLALPSQEADLLAFDFAVGQTNLIAFLQVFLVALLAVSAAVSAWFVTESFAYGIIAFIVTAAFVFFIRARLLDFYSATQISWSRELGVHQLRVDGKVLHLHQLWATTWGAVLFCQRAPMNEVTEQHPLPVRVLLVRNTITDENWHAFNVWRVWRTRP